MEEIEHVQRMSMHIEYTDVYLEIPLPSLTPDARELWTFTVCCTCGWEVARPTVEAANEAVRRHRQDYEELA